MQKKIWVLVIAGMVLCGFAALNANTKCTGHTCGDADKNKECVSADCKTTGCKSDCKEKTDAKKSSTACKSGDKHKDGTDHACEQKKEAGCANDKDKNEKSKTGCSNHSKTDCSVEPESGHNCGSKDKCGK